MNTEQSTFAIVASIVCAAHYIREGKVPYYLIIGFLVFSISIWR